MGRPAITPLEKIRQIFLDLDVDYQDSIIEDLKQWREFCVIRDSRLTQKAVDKPKRQRKAKPAKEKSFFAVEGSDVLEGLNT